MLGCNGAGSRWRQFAGIDPANRGQHHFGLLRMKRAARCPGAQRDTIEVRPLMVY